jgi:hypothetical protein
MFRLSLGSFNLWMCTSSVGLETHLNGHVLSIGHVMVWTLHINSEYGDLRSVVGYVISIQMVIVIPSVVITVIFIIIIIMHLLDHGIFTYYFTLTWLGGTCGVHLYSRVCCCCCVLAVDPDFDPRDYK